MFVVIMLESESDENLVAFKKKLNTWNETVAYIRELYEAEYDLPYVGDSIEDSIKHIIENGEFKGEDGERSIILLDLTRID